MIWLAASLLIGYVIFRVADYFYRKPQVTGKHNKAVFITGCDSGFGHALALHLDKLGCPVFAGCLTDTGAQKLGEESSERLQTVIVDVSKSESIKVAYEFVKNSITPNTVLWGVVNNAGVGGAAGPIPFVTREDFIKTFQVNTFGAADVTATFLPLLKKSAGRLVLTASVTGRMPLYTSPVYCASKHAVEALGGCFRQELKQWGIHVSLIEPGMFKTNINEGWGAQRRKQWERFPKEVVDEYGQQFLEEGNEIMDKSTAGGSLDLAPVTQAYTQALFAVHPKAHYAAGPKAGLCNMISLLPAWAIDALTYSELPVPTPAALQRDS